MPSKGIPVSSVDEAARCAAEIEGFVGKLSSERSRLGLVETEQNSHSAQASPPEWTFVGRQESCRSKEMGVVKPFTRDQELFALAKHIHSEIERELKVVDGGLTRITELLGQMRRQRLWKLLGFRSFENYIKRAHPKLANSRGTLYNLLAIDDLTKGDNPIPKEIVNQMGLKKAVEMSRLEPYQRTDEVINIALKQPLSEVRNRVRAELNKELPPDEQKPMTQMFTLLLPEDTFDELNELLDELEYAEGVRDGDMTRTLRQKAMDAIVKGARLYYQQELTEAREYKAALEGMEASPAVQAEEQQDH